MTYTCYYKFGYFISCKYGRLAPFHIKLRVGDVAVVLWAYTFLNAIIRSLKENDNEYVVCGRPVLASGDTVVYITGKFPALTEVKPREGKIEQDVL